MIRTFLNWLASRREYRHRAQWVSRAASVYQTHADVPLLRAREFAESLAEDSYEDWRDDPEGAVLEDFTYWTD